MLEKVSSVKEFKNLKCSHESICAELNIAKKKWLCFSIYGLPNPENLASFFEEQTDCLVKEENFMKILSF